MCADNFSSFYLALTVSAGPHVTALHGNGLPSMAVPHGLLLSGQNIGAHPGLVARPWMVTQPGTRGPGGPGAPY